MEISARGVRARRGSFELRVDALHCGSGGTAILGPNGAGKTTLLTVLQGVAPHVGDIACPARSAGVFAQPAVLRGSVAFNVAVVARSVCRISRRDAERRAHDMVRAVGLSASASTDARSLSSGERQRLALARALVAEPQAIFLDEPFANIDADGRPALRELLSVYVRRTNCALVIATQNLADVMSLTKHAVLLGGGTLVASFATENVREIPQPYIRALIAEAGATDDRDSPARACRPSSTPARK